MDEPLRHESFPHEVEHTHATASLPAEETRGTAAEIPEPLVTAESVEPEVAAAITSADDDARELEFADSDSSPRTTSSEIGLRVVAALVAVAAWVVPGLGHVITRRWGRGLVFFACAGGLAVTGYLLRGNVFAQHSSDPFGLLGFLADAGSGVFYFLAKFFEAAGPDVSRAAGDYGTRLIAAAGIVNLLGVFDAYEIAMGRRA
ncbi:MAG: DUF6677 family protein [Candidatus Acidiferrales bacterium]